MSYQRRNDILYAETSAGVEDRLFRHLPVRDSVLRPFPSAPSIKLPYSPTLVAILLSVLTLAPKREQWPFFLVLPKRP